MYLSVLNVFIKLLKVDRSKFQTVLFWFRVNSTYDQLDTRHLCRVVSS